MLSVRIPVKLATLLVVLVGCATAHPAAVVEPPRAPEAIVAVHEPSAQAERPGRVVVVETSMEILDRITFVGDTTELAPSSFRMLDAIAETLAGNPSIMLVQVRGHTDAPQLDRVARADLARARAEAVVTYLVDKGIDPLRLEAYGAADAEPIGPPGDPGNARIDLLILDRDTE